MENIGTIISKGCSIIIFLFLLCYPNVYAQDEEVLSDSTTSEEDFVAEDSVEIFLIENFVTPEVPHTLKLSFYTSLPVKSKLLINRTIDYSVSDNFQEDHNASIDLTSYKFESELIPFVIIIEDSAGNSYQSENYEFEFPREVKIESESNFLLLCLFGGVVFGLPAPSYVKWGEVDYFSLTKEIPLLFLRSSGYAYPAGYFSLEYSYIFNAEKRNFFRVGYKHLIEIPGIEYLSPGVNGFTNFNGFNGISPEVSLGLFKIFNSFTVYTRYRFNAKPGEAGSEFHEITLGLYSGFFAIYL